MSPVFSATRKCFETLKTPHFSRNPENRPANHPRLGRRLFHRAGGIFARDGVAGISGAKTQRAGNPDFCDGHQRSLSVEKGRRGFYPESIEAEVSPERLRRFFTKEDGGYRISKTIRDLCVFAKQNVTSDPPFSRMDLVSCRNLLIYLTPRVATAGHFHVSLRA